MVMFSGIAIIMSLIVLIFFGGGICLIQFFLSRTESKIPGLVIPSISFIISAVVGVGRIIYDFQCTLDVICKDIIVFILLNIPTGIFMLIYFLCRRGRGKKDEINKMNIHDL